ncbi:MAG TPA: GNAT family N-acetyltransferase [Polyangiaceae bacterium]
MGTDQPAVTVSELGVAHLDAATAVLAAAFAGDPLIRWCCGDREDAAMPIAFRVTLGQLIPARSTFGAFIGERLVAVAMLQKPDGGFGLRNALAAGLWRLPFAAGALGTTRLLGQVALTERFKQRLLPNERYLYFDTLGVHPEFANRGIGSELARRSLAALASERHRCLLLTHVERNVRLYERLGFSVIGDYRLPLSTVHFRAMVAPETR